jgi:hypothetical protein
MTGPLLHLHAFSLVAIVLTCSAAACGERLP